MTFTDDALVLAFDGDDTLWHNEQLFQDTQGMLHELLSHHADAVAVHENLLTVERRNLATFGYGVKGFVLSMIETAIEVSGSSVSAADIQRIIDLGKAMLTQPTELLEDVQSTIASLSTSYPLMLITKGDLLHQETKIASSGLADYFTHIEIVSEKDSATYRRLLARYDIDAQRFVMVGNSLASDVLPVIEIGARAVHIPYHVTWELEMAAVDDTTPFPTLATIGDLPEVLASWR